MHSLVSTSSCWTNSNNNIKNTFFASSSLPHSSTHSTRPWDIAHNRTILFFLLLVSLPIKKFIYKQNIMLFLFFHFFHWILFNFLSFGKTGKEEKKNSHTVDCVWRESSSIWCSKCGGDCWKYSWWENFLFHISVMTFLFVYLGKIGALQSRDDFSENPWFLWDSFALNYSYLLKWENYFHSKNFSSL